jgi:glycosyltransferase involved in cell wall biosynthesis
MTDCNFVTEGVFERDPSGRIWAGPAFGDELWSEQLLVFDTIRIAARVRDVEGTASGTLLENPKVSLDGLPYYRGVQQFILRLPPLLAAIWKISGNDGAFLLRLPGAAGTLMALALRLRRKPYAVQLVGNPSDALAGPGVARLLIWLRGFGAFLTRSACRRASVVSYVTKETLQQAFPAGRDAASFPCSDIDLPDERIVGEARGGGVRNPVRLLLCGSLAQLYKGVDTLIEAIAIMRQQGQDAVAEIAGDGLFRPYLENLARQRGVADRVHFLGTIDRDEVFDRLDATDIFVMPSRTEGLPRALVEAFARAVPSIASDVGGIPELLPERDRVPASDPRRLADEIASVSGDDARYQAMSRRNLGIARDYARSVLKPRRQAFYLAVAALSGASNREAAARGACG